jgi:hypothetical protein
MKQESLYICPISLHFRSRYNNFPKIVCQTFCVYVIRSTTYRLEKQDYTEGQIFDLY